MPVITIIDNLVIFSHSVRCMSFVVCVCVCECVCVCVSVCVCVCVISHWLFKCSLTGILDDMICSVLSVCTNLYKIPLQSKTSQCSTTGVYWSVYGMVHITD